MGVLIPLSYMILIVYDCLCYVLMCYVRKLYFVLHLFLVDNIGERFRLRLLRGEG